jgi:uncharacterized protein YhdP
MKKLFKVFISSAVVTTILILLSYSGYHYMAGKLEVLANNLTSNITKEIGYPVKIKKIKLNWAIKPYLSMNEFSIYKKDTAIPIIIIDKVNIHASLLKLLFKQKFAIEKIVVDAPRLMLKYSKDKKLTINVLNMQSGGSQLDYSDFMAILNNISQIEIKRGDIHWVGSDKVDIPLSQTNVLLTKQNDTINITAKGTVVGISPTFVTLDFNLL